MRGLLNTYLGYSLGFILSIILDHFLVAADVHHKIAWVITLGATSIINFVTVSYFAAKTSELTARNVS